jgi:hypothetical protein
MSQDPIGLEAGDANLYRYVVNNPTNSIDPTGLFTYEVVSGPEFRGKAPIGYLNLRVDMIYPKAGKDGRPAKGSFVQVSTVATTVVTCAAGELKATPTVKYIPDRSKLEGATRFKDTLFGPDFDKKLTKDAVLVFSYVLKEHGFTTANVRDISNSDPITEAEAKALKKFEKGFDTGTYKYYYLWLDPGKAKGIKKLGEALLDELDEKQRDALKELLDGAKIDLDKFQGQIIYGDAGLDKRADIDGKPKD